MQHWDYHILVPLLEDGVEVLADDSLEDEVIKYDVFMYECHHDALSSALCVGDTFAVNPHATSNYEDLYFYLVKCISVKEKVENGYIDEWKNVIDKGSYVVQGFYYKKVDLYTFKCFNKHPMVHILSNLVHCIKTAMEHMPNRAQMYTITPKNYEAI